MADDQLTPLSLPPLLTNLTKYSQGEEFEKIKHDDATDEDQQSLDSDDLAIKSDESIEDARLEQDHNDGAVNQNDHQGNANDKEGKKVGVGELTQKRKQGTPGRPVGSRNKRANTKPSIDDPSKVLSKIPSSAKFIRNVKRRNPDLLSTYSDFRAAKQERDIVAKFVEETQEEVTKLRAKLKAAEKSLEQGNIRLENEEELVKRAADAVGEAEMKVPCRWNTNFQKLVAYKEKYGHINLPNRARDDKELDSLCVWVSSQKSKYQAYLYGEQGTPHPWRITALENLGIQWQVKAGKWKKHYEDLLAFKEQHGHCMVPTRTSKEYKDLGSWVAVQRMEYRNAKEGKASQLNPERTELLEKAGFVWNVTDYKWQEMYEKLVTFRSEQGHCNVPERYPQDQTLSNWVERQRKEYSMLRDETVNSEKDAIGRTRRMRMTEERMKLMNDIGFQW
uniref:Helicase-associated domain-containing protein n=3 Tax=Ditylum brightwellii TaxID=49249 RepID=A0A7S1ZGB7_9STRA